MRIRHSPPSLVSMWMLDVFCCALGCVTLLWLMNNRAATEQAEKARSTQADLQASLANAQGIQDELARVKKQLNVEIENLKAKLLALTSERDLAADKLAVARTDISSLEKKLSVSDTQLQKTMDELAKKQKNADELSKQLVTVQVSTDDLRRLLREKEMQEQSLVLKNKKAEEQINDLDARLRTVAKAAEKATADQSAMRKSGEELASAKSAVAKLQKQLDDANANLIDLQGEKKKLADTYDRLRIESESKFAGIAMTGKRVCFVVDISGSMKLIDDRTPAPQKWSTVVDTVTKVMRTLPDLERFQVVIFSRKARFLFGDGEWQTFQGEGSLNRVKDALMAVDPVGDTNMYEAFDLSFRLRSSGMDTIYFFSDGLPTSGIGLTEQQEKTLPESQRTEALARHIRQTLSSRWNVAQGGKRVRINSVGFFFESPEVGAFLWALSRENEGSFVGMSKP